MRVEQGYNAYGIPYAFEHFHLLLQRTTEKPKFNQVFIDADQKGFPGSLKKLGFPSIKESSVYAFKTLPRLDSSCQRVVEDPQNLRSPTKLSRTAKVIVFGILSRLFSIVEDIFVL
jgi:hypothetical protein